MASLFYPIGTAIAYLLEHRISDDICRIDSLLRGLDHLTHLRPTLEQPVVR